MGSSRPSVCYPVRGQARARDLSQKVKSAVATRMKRGEYIGPFERLHERLVS